MELVLIKPESNEWNYMWDWLASHPLNKDLSDPSTAMSEDQEVWQYMGSFRQNNQTIHEFRHRNHPVTKQREYLKVMCTQTMSDEDIEKVIQVK
jgi:hypothetical protein